ncbi:MAG: prepilin-type N-terminal cleavage/methylation domain-containing protein [Epsilonproteobacteria bacterium]|nr:prepilin-type N-terminal cleavage/methylation domain-containing protein [Campylobacterota bacterium]
MKFIKRGAFTLIEMIMVIVVLGVIAMIGTDIIAKMYEGYMRTQIISELQQRTELALDQITKRLKYRIKESTITKDSSNPADLKPLAEDRNSTNLDMLEWIGYDNEGFLGEHDGTRFVPGWSGFIDLKNPNTDENETVTSGSILSAADRTIFALSYGEINFSSTDNNAQYPALIFKKLSSTVPSTFGLDPNLPNDRNNTFAVRRIGEDRLQFVNDNNHKILFEQYNLAWSAYAIVPQTSNEPNDFNLTLHYNYQPWHGEDFNDGNSALIAQNVSTFRFTQTGSTIRIKLCIQDGNRTGRPIGFCKEKAVL